MRRELDAVTAALDALPDTREIAVIRGRIEAVKDLFAPEAATAADGTAAAPAVDDDAALLSAGVEAEAKTEDGHDELAHGF